MSLHCSWFAPQRGLVAVVISLSLSGSNAFCTTPKPFAGQAVDAAALQFIAQGYAPGVSVAIVRKGQVLYAKGYGLENLETQAPTTNESIFKAGSITKEFIATAVMVMVQEGRVSLDDPLSKYVPELTRAGPVTLRMLLTHTSGLHDYTHTEPFAAEQFKHPTTEEMVGFITSMQPLTDFPPGTKWAYSNTNYFVLGAVVERVSGQSLSQFLASNVTSPAGIQNTAIDDERDVVLHRASGYSPIAASHGRYKNAPYFSMAVAGGAGGLRSTALDLAKWHQALFSGHIVTLQSLNSMTSPAKLIDGTVPVREDAPITLGPPNYGFGLELGSLDGEQATGHGGSVPGFTAYLVTFPKLQTTIAIMTNGDPNWAEGFRDIERAALKGLEN